MDKAYTLIFGLDGSGQIPGHALMDYTSPDALFKSLILQNPDKNLEIYTGGGTVGETEHEFVDFEQMLTTVGITKDVLLEIAGVTKEQLNSGNVNIDIQINKISVNQISQILEGLKYYWMREKRSAAVNSTSTYAPIVKAIAEKFNEYNKSNFTVDQAKNKVIAVIRYASSDLRNLQASEVPMISKAVNDCIKNSQQNVDIPINVDKQYVNEDPTHIANF